MIYGNKEGIRDSLLAQMEALYDLNLTSEVFACEELLNALAAFSCAINREISVYIARSGEVMDVTIGSIGSVELKDMRLRRNARRLSGIRCIHTHPGGDARLSDVDISSLRCMRFDAMAAVGVAQGHATGVQAAFLGEAVGGENSVTLTDVVGPKSIPQSAWMEMIERADADVLRGTEAVGERKERAWLVGLDSQKSLDELARLAQTAGAVVVGSTLQKKTKPDAATYIGSGKAEALSLDLQAADADIAIFDDELSGIALRNLESILHGVKVLDRTALILDIFAQRALSREGRLQVEMAQLSYQLPRLLGHGVAMSRLGGGIGTRGPGETRLEMDRRRIRRRMVDLGEEIDKLAKQRSLRRTRREKNSVPVVALVGYTNAGKSTLLNKLGGAHVLAEDMLFATLDPVARTVNLPNGGTFLLVDTVGFISKLPHALVDAFHSTLEEALLADLLVIVEDASSDELAHEHDVVMGILNDLGAGNKPYIDVINKCDLRLAPGELPGALCISAKTGEGIDTLLEQIQLRLRGARMHIRATVPYAKGGLISELHEHCNVLAEQYGQDSVCIEVIADAPMCDYLTARLGENALEHVKEGTL